MVCSDFAVLRKTLLRNYLLRKTKEIFIDIFTRLYLPNTVRQWHKATILEFYQIFWSHWYPSSGKHIYRDK